METTIAVKSSTAQVLLRLKEKLRAKSVDEAIVKILQKTEKISLSRFGSNPKLRSFTEKERAKFHEL
ncbi:hypothetical protein HYV50_03025 [Candidatus Pacearchaeota archaeon]|nr:hypothetical protein [Candidatus Pacearchaeota archaeon]